MLYPHVISAAEHRTAVCTCRPALAHTLAVVDIDAVAPAVDHVACQHLLARDAQHVLKPWYDDTSSASAEPVASTRFASELLMRTAGGTASGLSFVGAVGPDIPATVRHAYFFLASMRLLLAEGVRNVAALECCGNAGGMVVVRKLSVLAMPCKSSAASCRFSFESQPARL